MQSRAGAGTFVVWSVTLQYNLHMPGRIAPKKFIAALLFPKYSSLVDKLNWNARWRATKKETGDIPVFQTREELHRFVQSRSEGPVDYLEFGVWRGESLQWWCDGKSDQESRFLPSIRSKVYRKTGAPGFRKVHSVPEGRFLTSWTPDCNSWSAGSKTRFHRSWSLTKQDRVR